MRPWESNISSKRKPIIEDKDPIYGSARWDRTRKTHKKRSPHCVINRRAGIYRDMSDLDHIIPMDYGGNKWASSNHQGLTKRMHSLKTNREIRIQGPLYEFDESSGLPLRQWGKLIPNKRKPVVCIIGPSGSGKSTVIEAMDARKHFNHVHHIDNTNWSFITDSILNEPGYHLLECVGGHFAFRKLLLDQRLSFYVFRIDRPEEDCLKVRPKLSQTDWLKSYYHQKTIPADTSFIHTNMTPEFISSSINTLLWQRQ